MSGYTGNANAKSPHRHTVSATSDDIAAAIAAHEAKYHAPAPPDPTPPPPPTGIPAWRPNPSWLKDFSTGIATPFRSSTIPSDPNHLSTAHGGTASADNPMAVYDRYGDNSTNPPTPLHKPDFSGGAFVREVATRRPDGLYAGTILSTCDDPAGGAATRVIKRGTNVSIRFAFRANVGYVTWQTPLWLTGWTGWSWNGCEVDICEVINGQLTFNLHNGPWGSNRGVVAITPPADLATVFHTAGVDLTAAGVQFVFDEKPVGPFVAGAFDHDLAYLSDSKVGVPWENKGPNSTTPDPAFVDLAWITEHTL